MKHLLQLTIITILFTACGKHQTKAEVKKAIKVLEAAKEETTDPDVQDTLQLEILKKEQQLKDDDKIKKEIEKYNEEHKK
jgi:PBP1b-binding outer membrane lipoprotein LpoB